jgi:hypothetical protein
MFLVFELVSEKKKSSNRITVHFSIFTVCSEQILTFHQVCTPKRTGVFEKKKQSLWVSQTVNAVQPLFVPFYYGANILHLPSVI